ncbi:MAG: alkylhydroperoxidase-related (seleno)protein [Chloroflexi bacterium]|nr:alkylhydroperoxidase-related (seleno)protein [Chloroflexota bacterium]MDA1147591.1 alkylhydroperoxidase-related (seleno)protein [Chloroflexota bacterium]
MTAASDRITLPIPDIYAQAHAAALAGFVRPGSHLDGPTRRAIVEESRAARDCAHCAARAEALSAAVVDGAHSTVSDLSPHLVELVHRLTTDPGRLTHAWFEGTIAGGVTEPQYVEIAGLIGTSTIADTWTTALVGAPPVLPAAEQRTPSGETNPHLADIGAYVGVMDLEHPLPRFKGARQSANITRALALVPSAVDEFWDLFMPHYRPMATEDGDEMQRPQIELVASRTSALNECFY